MELDYLHLPPEQDPPNLTNCPFCVVIVSEVSANPSWRNRVAEWLVEGRCLFVVAWGVECKDWHDTVDWAVLEAFNFGDIPDDKFVMTTWHDDEPLSEALWFAGHCAFHPHVELEKTVILHIAEKANCSAMLKTYADSQTIAEVE